MKMKKFVKLMGIAVVAATVSASVVAGGKAAPNKENYEKAVVIANEALDKAASVGGEWRDSRWEKSDFVKYKSADGKEHKSSYMGAAAIAAENGDYESAMKFLEVATFQGNMGYEQSVGQKNVGPRF
jgi:predicted small secreted protein